MELTIAIRLLHINCAKNIPVKSSFDKGRNIRKTMNEG
jgi:hypothetical protein